eukprot:scaffold43653_cov39-Phaeocystis_antarctica.AAC.1
MTPLSSTCTSVLELTGSETQPRGTAAAATRVSEAGGGALEERARTSTVWACCSSSAACAASRQTTKHAGSCFSSAPWSVEGSK